MKTDFDKWRDEDDSDVEEGQDMQLEEVSGSVTFLDECVTGFAKSSDQTPGQPTNWSKQVEVWHG